MDRTKNEEEDPMEKELAEDATWKRIQRNTFTRWANNHISSVNKHIEDLEQDLSDGLRLISLIEVLSGKRINRFNKRPTVRAQKLENVGIVLRFLTTDERMKIVNIDSTDVVDSNLKLILGLVWTLILHYSISTPMWEGEEDELDEKGNKKKETPKHRLLRWINNKLPELRITNFTSDWNSGIALAALVDAIAPGLFPDWQDLKSENSLEIARKALALADKWLSCPQLITAEDLINPKVDELSMMTYLSNFPNAKLKEDAPLTQRCNPNRVRVYGAGVQKNGVVCGAQTTFTVETFSAGEGKLDVKVLDSKNKEIAVNIKFNDDRSKTYTCSYTASKEDQYKVIVYYAGKEVPKSPFEVNVEGKAGDANKVTASGPGLEKKGVQVGKQTYFDVDISQAGLGQVEVNIVEPDGKPSHAPLRIVAFEQTQTEEISENKKPEENKISRRQKEQQPELVKPSKKKQENEIKLPLDVPTKYRVEYVPQKSGSHKIEIRFAGKELPKSPYEVNIAPPCDSTKVKAFGRGLQLTGIRVGDSADFQVFTEGAGQGEIQVYVQGPDGKNIPVDMNCIDTDIKSTKKQNKKPTVINSKDGPITKDIASGETYNCVYKPVSIGKHTIVVQYGDQEILRSPFEVNVSKAIDSKIIAYGPGLKGGIAQSPAVFTVDTRGDESTLGFTIEGPSQAKITCKDNGDGSAEVSYLPSAPGEYGIHILSNGEDIPNSPYVAQVLPRTDYNPELVKVEGKGVQPNGIPRNVPVKFQVDSRKAGLAPTEVSVMNCETLKNIPIKCEKRRGSILELDSNSKKKATVETQVKKTKISTVKQNSIEKVGEIIDCEYIANELGKHIVQVNFGGVAVPGSPFKVNVGELGQPDKVKVFGPGIENGLLPGSKTVFTIDARKAGIGEISANVVELRSGRKVPINLINNNDDTYTVEYNVDTLGSYRVEVCLDGKSSGGTPITVRAAEPLDKSQVKILKFNNTAFLNTPNTFVVDTRDLKDKKDIQVKCEITCLSGKKKETKVEKLEDGTHLVTFRPDEKGLTLFNVFCDNQLINDKSLKTNVEEGFDEKKITVYGPGLKEGNVGEYNEFTIDTRNAGFAPLNLAIEGPDEAEMTCHDNGDGTYLCKYKPELEGAYEIQIKFGNKEVSGSPFISNVKTKIDLSKVKIEGPGVEEKVLASLPTHININAKNVGKNCKPNVEIHGPDGKKCDSKMKEKDGIFCVEYTPEEIGKYQVTCNFNNTPVKGTPITVNSMPTGNPKKCIVQEKIGNLMKVGQENCVTINTKEAGKGNITCKITSLSKPKSKVSSKNDKKVIKVTEEEDVCEETEKKVNVKVKDNKDGTFSVYYRVDEPGEYKMDLKFGGQSISNGVHSFTVVTSEEETETTTTTTKTKDIKKNEEKTTTNSTKTTKKKTIIKTESYEEEITTEYRIIELKNVPIPKITHTKKQIKTEEKISSLNKLIGTVKLPNGEIEKAIIVDNHDNTISVQYQPKMEGDHQLSITCDDENIQGSPFRFYVNKLSSSKVTAFGPGLTHGIAGEPCQFKVFTKDAGSGGLKISIEGPSKAIIDSKDDGNNTVLVAYTPPTPGEYRICISFGGQPINGSPFTPKITGEGKQRSAISVSGSSEIKLKITETYTKEDRLISTIVTPSGIEEPCYLKKIAETGQLAISFTPRESGEHLVHVKKNDAPLLGSPFKVNVLPKEIGNSSKVKITGTGHKYGKTMIENNFTIDTREAGYGAISLSMEGPSKAEIVSNETEPGLMKILYKAKQPGYYLMNLKFADSHVNGSPFTIEITGAGEQYQKENLLKETKTLNEHKMGSICKMTFTISQAITQEKLFAFVTSPSGKRNEALIKSADQSNKQNNTQVVEFTPNEIGEHIIEIFYNKEKATHIPGSPFKFTVGQLQNAGGANSVRAFGSGLEGGIVGQKGKFIINTREAGAGSLGITMEGPGKAILELNEKTDELTYVGSYLTDKAGEYRLAIKYNDQHILQSPFRIWVMPEQDLAKKIVLEGLPAKTSSIINQTTTMQIRLNSVILNQRNINQTTTKKSSSTTTTTTTITKTTTKSSNQDNELIAKLVSPSGKEEICFLTEIDEKECVIQFVPKEPGPHQLHVRLNGVHVSNSPFNFFVRDDKNLNKQEISKKEIKKEVLNKEKEILNKEKEIKETKKTLTETTKKTEKIEYTVINCTKTGVKLTGAGLTPGQVKCGQKTEFIVDTTNAPMGKLNVKVDGPYKAQINLSLCDLGYKASYTVEGPGEYNVQVKYNDTDITGSPYKVKVDGDEKNTKNLGIMKVN